MGNTTLEHLLKVEAEAAALVNDAQEEADRRIHENDEKNRIAYEERFKAEIQTQQVFLEEEKDRIKKIYQKTLDDYRE